MEEAAARAMEEVDPREVEEPDDDDWELPPAVEQEQIDGLFGMLEK